MKIIKIIDDYVDCDKKDKCCECEANKCIGGSNETYCVLLSLYTRRLKQKINEVIKV